MCKPLDDVLDVTVGGTKEKLGRTSLFVSLWLLLRKLGKYWHGRFFLSTVWLAS